MSNVFQHLALEKSLQTNGTGRKEPGLQAILATLKKQNSLFGELLTLPMVDLVRVKWNTNALSLSCTVATKYYEQLLENPLRSLFINMKVPIENGVAGIPKLEPLSEFLNPTKNFKYSSDGLDELYKREMRSTDKRLLVRWFWLSREGEDITADSIDVVVQFTWSKCGKRKLGDLDPMSSSSDGTENEFKQRIISELQQIRITQQKHNETMENTLKMVVDQLINMQNLLFSVGLTNPNSHNNMQQINGINGRTNGVCNQPLNFSIQPTRTANPIPLPREFALVSQSIQQSQMHANQGLPLVNLPQPQITPHIAPHVSPTQQMSPVSSPLTSMQSQLTSSLQSASMQPTPQQQHALRDVPPTPTTTYEYDYLTEIL